MDNIAWFNGTRHDINIFELDEHGDVAGYLQRGGPLLKFKTVKVIPPSGTEVRLLSLHHFPPSEVVIEGVTIKTHQPWTKENLNLDDLPGKTLRTDYDSANVQRVYLIVSLPVGEFLFQRTAMGGNLVARATDTEVLCPDTGPGSVVVDEKGGILGVLGMKTFGHYYYPAPIY